jgi:GNAT superfamily N-acetyltransferase
MNKKIWSDGILALSLSDTQDLDVRDHIHEQIKAFNDATSEPHRKARQDGVRPLHILLRDEKGKLRGGLIADTYWNWLDIDDFWLEESARRWGHGRRMLQAAEREAIARGCRFAKLETFSFQARGFYEKCGYKVVGQLDEYPPGQSFFWMHKEITATEG